MNAFRDLTDLEKDTVDKLVRKGERTETEIVASFNEDGHELFDEASSGLQTRCQIPDATIAQLNANTPIVIRHNHPKQPCSGAIRSFSCLDLQLIRDHSSLVELSAHGLDGTRFSIRLKDGVRSSFVELFPSLQNAECLATQALQPLETQHTPTEIQNVMKGGTIDDYQFNDLDYEVPSLLCMHVVNLVLAQRGYVEYEVDPGPQLASVLNQYKNQLKKAASFIQSEQW